jgi:hypothetical protein
MVPFGLRNGLLLTSRTPTIATFGRAKFIINWTADGSFPLLVRAHEYYKFGIREGKVLVPCQVLNIGDPITHTELAFEALHLCIRYFASVEELKDRFIKPGPSVNQLLCMYLNPNLNKQKVSMRCRSP